MKTLVSDRVGQELLFWLVGFLDAAPATTLVFVGAYVAIGITLLLWDAGRLNLLALGDESATFLGVNVRALELRVFFACSLVVGAIVSVTGLIGFVGLIVPHALRRVVGPDVRVLLPASVFGGAATLILCDALSRGAFRFLHTQPPVGAVTALVELDRKRLATALFVFLGGTLAALIVVISHDGFLTGPDSTGWFKGDQGATLMVIWTLLTLAVWSLVRLLVRTSNAGDGSRLRTASRARVAPAGGTTSAHRKPRH